MNGKDLRAVLSNNIKLYRCNHGWSQADLAEKAEISITFLSSIERCVKWPYPDTLVKIAKALKIEEFELFRLNKAVTDDTSTLIERLVGDIALSVKDSIEKTYRRYRGHLKLKK
ncbi:MAG: helix-turn-helix domain-containing protein [Treponema sp.]|jgi:transcriptional regulator with XRE-family HTH domain|nr:helix-turn-helix domain-containing protein [Treponema sp.]